MMNKDFLEKYRFFILGAAILSIGIFFLLPGNDDGVVDYSEMYGVWRSTDPRYEKCYLVIDEVSFVIGAADGQPYVYFLKSVEKFVDNEINSYTFATENPEGEEFDFWFNLKTIGENKELNFKNQPLIVWYKEKRP